MTAIYMDELNIAEHLKNANEDVLKEIISTCEKIVEAGIYPLRIVENIYDKTLAGAPFHEILYHNFNEMRDTIIQIQKLIDRADIYPDTADDNHALAKLISDGFGAIVSTGPLETDMSWNPSRMHKIASKKEIPDFLRRAFINDKKTEKDLVQFIPYMYPALIFAEHPCFKKLSLPFSSTIANLISHLSYLNDYANLHFNRNHQDHEIIALAGSQGVSMSPEGPRTRSNNRAMREREITIQNVKIMCEWHTKLTPTTGRIHFNAKSNRLDDIKRIIGEKVLVGLFVDHLPL